MSVWLSAAGGADALLSGMPKALAGALKPFMDTASEIRVRAERCVTVFGGETPAILPVTLTATDVQRLADTLCGRALHTHQASAACGYVTLRGGHRMGLCGQVVMDGGHVWQLRTVGSLCVRVARDIRGVSEPIRDAAFVHGAVRSMLILGSPGTGKTTLTRDLARWLSEQGVNVCIADERCELAACENGIPSLDVGPNTDVLPGMQKSKAVEWLLRALCPKALVMDELFGTEDMRAVHNAMRSGVPVLATAHASSLESAKARADLSRLLGDGAFDRIVLMRAPHEPPKVIV